MAYRGIRLHDIPKPGDSPDSCPKHVAQRPTSQSRTYRRLRSPIAGYKDAREFRTVIDLSCLNRHLDIPSLRMETAERIRCRLHQDHWITSQDHRITSQDHRITSQDHRITSQDHWITSQDHWITSLYLTRISTYTHPSSVSEVPTLSGRGRLFSVQSSPLWVIHGSLAVCQSSKRSRQRVLLLCSALAPVEIGSVGNRLDVHNRSSVWPNQPMIDCIIGSWNAILKISAHGRWYEGMISAINPLVIYRYNNIFNAKHKVLG